MVLEFQKKVLQTLAMRAGPAAGDITRDICAKMGIAPDALTPALMDRFASLAEADLAGLVSPAEAKATAADLRVLK